MLLLMAGCIHTYPDEEKAVDPAFVETTLVLRFSDEWQDLTPESGNTRSQAKKRVVMEIARRGALPQRREFAATVDMGEEKSIIVPFTLRLEPALYGLYIWCEDSVENSKDRIYDVTDFADIPAPDPEYNKNDLPDCHVYSSELDLTGMAGKWDVAETVEVRMSRPEARFCIKADDYSRFVEAMREDIDRGENYFVEVSYDCAVAGAYNLYEDVPTRPAEGVSARCGLNIITIPGVEMPIADDRLFVGHEPTELELTLTVYNSAKAVVARKRGVKVPLERGKLTTLHGDFLTDFIVGGISVDTAWEGEIIIDMEDI